MHYCGAVSVETELLVRPNVERKGKQLLLIKINYPGQHKIEFETTR